MLKKLPGTVVLTRPIVVPTLVLGLTLGFALFALVTALQGASPFGSLTTLVIILLLVAALRDFPLLHKRPLMLMLAVVLLVPFRIDTDWTFARSISIADIALAAAGLLVALLALGNRRLSHMSRPAFWWWGILYLIFASLSVLWSPSVAATIRQVLILAAGLSTFFILDTFLSTEKLLVFAIRVFVLLGILSTGVAWLYWFSRSNWLELYEIRNQLDIVSWQTRLGSPLWGASNLFASLLLLSLPISIVGTFNSSRAKFNSGWFWIALLLSCSILATLSIGVGAALVLTLIVLSKDLIKRVRYMTIGRWVIMIALSLVVVLAGAVALRVLNATALGSPIAYITMKLGQFPGDMGTQSRLGPITEIALPGIGERPMFGWGLGSTGNVIDPQTGLGIGNWHNVLVQTWYELGTVGGLILLALFASVFQASLQVARQARRTDSANIVRHFALAAPATILGTYVALSLEANWEASVFQWLWWFYLAILSASIRHFSATKATS